MFIPWAFGMAGFIYAFPVVAGMSYVADVYLHVAPFNWTTVVVISLVPAFILAIKALDW